MRTHVVYQMNVPVCMGFGNKAMIYNQERMNLIFGIKQKLKHDG